MVKKRILSVVLAAVMLLTSVPAFADDSDRFRVTSNWCYDKNGYANTNNLLGSYATREEAVKAIRSQPYATRGEWYIFDMQTKKVVYPLKLSSARDKINKAVSWATAVTKDARHGYTCEGELSNRNPYLDSPRWGRNGDYSCSTLAIMSYELSGFANIRLAATKNNMRFTRYGKTYRGVTSLNIGKALLATGKFKDITAEFQKHGMSALKAGDIITPYDKLHVALYGGGGRLIEGRGNELGSEYAIGKSGNQTGVELLASPFRSGFYYAYRPIS